MSHILADAGEKMGLQITILLTMVIYIDLLQDNMPVFDAYGNSPLLLNYFIVTIVANCLCLLVSTHTLFLYHVSEYESVNFSASEAKTNIFLARVFNIFACGLWKIEIPENTKQLAETKFKNQRRKSVSTVCIQYESYILYDSFETV